VPLTANPDDRDRGDRGGSIMRVVPLAPPGSFLYTRFREICEIMAAYDVSFR